MQGFDRRLTQLMYKDRRPTSFTQSLYQQLQLPVKIVKLSYTN